MRWFHIYIYMEKAIFSTIIYMEKNKKITKQYEKPCSNSQIKIKIVHV
jgi:hypothetical protein